MAHSYMNCEKHGLYYEDVGCTKCEEESRARYKCAFCSQLFQSNSEAAKHEREHPGHECVIFHAEVIAAVKAELRPGRSLQCGDWATTDYNGPGTCTTVQILEVCANGERGHSQSGIMFRVAGERGQRVMRNERPDSWYDADWFTPLERL